MAHEMLEQAVFPGGQFDGPVAPGRLVADRVENKVAHVQIRSGGGPSQQRPDASQQDFERKGLVR